MVKLFLSVFTFAHFLVTVFLFSDRTGPGIWSLLSLMQQGISICLKHYMSVSLHK